LKILIAPDSFKGSLPAIDVANALEKGILAAKKAKFSIKKQALADGGEGSAEAICENSHYKKCICKTFDAFGRPISAAYFANAHENKVVLDMAAASGHSLIKKHERKILEANSYGTGIMVKHALDIGYSNFIIGLGGSATCDMGFGFASALGYTFLDKNGKQLAPFPKNFGEISTIIPEKYDENMRIDALYDVEIPLLGMNGAVQKYAEQKGANAYEKLFLEEKMASLQNLVCAEFSIIEKNQKGDGAAGGLGFGLRTFFGANLIKGFDIVATETHLLEKIAWADLIIGGEGKLDVQTFDGKVLFGLAELCKKLQKKLVVVCGSVELQKIAYEKMGFAYVVSLEDLTKNSEDSMQNAAFYLEKIGLQIALKHS